jgi:hypothetical protein
MTGISAGRMAAAAKLGKLLATPEGRQKLSPGGRARSVVPAEWDELISDVMDRLQLATSPATIAILRDDELVFLSVEPSGPGVGAEKASPNSTIGMLFQAVERASVQSLTFQITEWQAPVVATPVLA